MAFKLAKKEYECDTYSCTYHGILAVAWRRGEVGMTVNRKVDEYLPIVVLGVMLIANTQIDGLLSIDLVRVGLIAVIGDDSIDSNDVVRQQVEKGCIPRCSRADNGDDIRIVVIDDLVNGSIDKTVGVLGIRIDQLAMHGVVLLVRESRWHGDVRANRAHERLVLESNDPLEDGIKVTVARDIPIEETVRGGRR